MLLGVFAGTILEVPRDLAGSARFRARHIGGGRMSSYAGDDRGITGSPAGSADQDNPTISPLSSMSMRSAAGADERPGMVRMSPQMG